MAEHAWEKPVLVPPSQKPHSETLKFAVGGVLMLAAVVYLIVSGMASPRYFITIDELVNNPEYAGKTIRMSGAVIGDSIKYDSRNLTIDFTVANIPEDTTNLARTLHEAVVDSAAIRVKVHIENEVKPDLLRHEAQAILTGTLGADGVFYATELLLKCPSRFEENAPSQAEAGA